MKKTYVAPFVEIKEIVGENIMTTSFVAAINKADSLDNATYHVNFN